MNAMLIYTHPVGFCFMEVERLCKKNYFKGVVWIMGTEPERSTFL